MIQNNIQDGMNWRLSFNTRAEKGFKEIIRQQSGEVKNSNQSKREKIQSKIKELIDKLKTEGPCLRDEKKFRYDRNNDLFHIHFLRKPTYVITWSADQKNKQIVIVRVETHENCTFKRKFRS